MSTEQREKIQVEIKDAAEGEELPADASEKAAERAIEEVEAMEENVDLFDETTEEAQINPLQLVIEERDKLKDRLLRTAADYDNFRKRTHKDLKAAEVRGKEEVLRELLPVFDNLERAVAAAEDATDVASVVEGVQMVLSLFADSSKNLGLERVATVGERFDPAVHQAIQRIPSPDHEPNTVVAEVLPGYRIKDRLVRAAMVVVAQKPPQPSNEIEA